MPAGQIFTGEALDGVATPVLLCDGRVLVGLGSTKGGLMIDAAPAQGAYVNYVIVNAPGATSVKILLAGSSAELLIFEGVVGFVTFALSQGIFVPEGWSLRVVTAGALSSEGRVCVSLAPGLAVPPHTFTING